MFEDVQTTAVVALAILSAAGCIQHTDDFSAADTRTSNGVLALYTFAESEEQWGEAVVAERSGKTGTKLEIRDPGDDWEPADWPFEEFVADDEPEDGDARDDESQQDREDFYSADNNRSVRWVPDCDCMLFGGGKLRGTDTGRINNPIADSHAFSFELWLEADNLAQGGPARIATLSDGTGQRNFLLGQQGTDLELRIRTEESEEGHVYDSEDFRIIDDAVSTRLEHYVVTFEDGDVEVFRNGEPVYSDPLVLSQDQAEDEANGQSEEDGADNQSEEDDESTPDRHPAASLRNWEAGYELRLGNEVGFERRWLGSLHLVAIYDRALTDREVSRHFAAGHRAVR